MKVIKRILLCTLLAVALAFISLWAFVQYSRHVSYQASIHKRADVLIRVDKFDIYQQLLPDYFKGGRREKRELLRGIDIPANTFVYSVEGKQPTTFVTSLPVDDIDALQQSLKNPTWQAITKDGDAYVVSSVDGKWCVLFNEHLAAISFSFNKEDVNDILQDLLHQTNTMKVADSRFKDIAQQKGHITIRQRNNTASVNFIDGTVEANFEIHDANVKAPSTLVRQSAVAGNALNMWLYADVSGLFAGKTFSIDTFTIAADSLLAAHPTGIELSVGKAIIQRDSVVSYEYNDDFEKVATVTVQETATPGINFTLYATGNMMSDYLRRQGIVTNSTVVSRQFFPLYQLYATATDSQFSLSTINGAMPTANTISETDFLGLDANVQQLLSQSEFAVLKPYGVLFSTLKVRARMDGNIVKGNIRMHFRDTKSNALIQLF